MSEVDFFPYHNRHIIFKLNDGTELSGVLFDSMTGDTNYTFVATKNMIAWKKAERDADARKKLESQIDIENIVWAERLNY